MQAVRIASLSIISNVFIVGIKLVVGIITGSVAVISEAIHSTLDLMASIIAFFSLKISSRPPDRNHPYGHGKFENISGTFETLLIFIAGIWIIYESVNKLRFPSQIEFPLLGVSVMALAATINLIIGSILKKTGEKNHSVAMRSNALHLLTDVFSSLGVAVSLILVAVTNIQIIDPIIGIAIAIYIMTEAIKLGKESFLPLLDTSLTKEEQQRIVDILESFKNEYIEYHDLRTRRSGAEQHIDFHLVIASSTSVKTAHDLCDHIEKKLQLALYRPKVFIHIEPEHEREKYKNNTNS